MALPRRWSSLRPHPAGEAYTTSPHRFNTVPAGRRSGKTERAKRKIVMRALSASFDWEPRYFAGAPTRDQAKRIFWKDLKAMVPPDMLAGKPSESDLMIPMVNGSEIWVVGMDKPARIEGSPWDGGVLDEYGNMRPGAWGENIRPALADRMGWCDFIGVPEGRNHYYDLDRAAKAQMQEKGEASEWGSFTWFSADILPASEIEAARADLDERTFKQEFEASFINFEGMAYYPFNEREHTASLTYDPRATLAFCFDFNVEPGVAAVCQEQKLPGQYRRNSKGVQLLDMPIIGTGVIGEVWIPQNSNTVAVCAKLIKDWGGHQGRIVCYGDSSGGARGSAKVEGSDWELIKRELRAHFRDRISVMVKTANPRERARINAVNTRLKRANGEIWMMVDSAKAPNVVKDFEGVTLLKGGSGEIDKKASPKLTHLTDAIGYRVEYDFPVQENGMQRVEISGV